MKKVTFELKSIMNIYKKRKYVLALALLLTGGIAKAQVTVHGNVYGGGNIGEVVKTTDGTGNTSVIVNGGTIGDTLRLKHRVADKQMQVTTRVDYGNVYGGGNGYLITGHNPNNNAPIFDINAGRVQGNTSVYVGGDAVVRRAVYGGGNMASVGMYSADNGVATYTSGGHTVVTVTGNALIGPKKTDLTSPTPAELDSVKEFYNMTSLMSASQYADSAFKYLGANEGWVFGSSRGISGGLLRDHSFVDTTEVTISGNAQVLNVFGSGENGHVQKGTNVIVKDNALVGGVPLHGAGSYTVPASGIADHPGEYSGATYTLADKDSETAEDEFGMGREIPRGNVLGGGKGTDFISWFANPKFCYTSGRVYGNTHVTVQDNARIYNRVYGGGLISMVGTFTEEGSQDPDNHTVIGIESGGHTYVNINGGIIGSPGSNGHNNGEVYGGSRGLPGRPRKPGTGPYGLEPLTPMHQVVDEAYVGHTHVTVTDGTIYNSVYGGGANGHVQGNTYVTINGGTIGHDLGGWHGNVFAGGGGTARYTEGNAKKFSITAGRVFGNTNLNITGGTIKHNVYGGGALASVGTYLKYNGVERAYFGGGKATLNITGGTIGTNGDNNGMVFGSGRGEIMAPDQIMDTLTYMAYTFVNIGSRTVDPETGEASLSGDAKIKGSVYGSGENGHVYLESHVNVYSGTIGCTATEYAAMSEDDKVNKFPYRGNVYGAGCGTDKYDSDNDDVVDTYNPNSGYVWGQTEVNIYGGYISRSVYGAGAMASVGFIDHTRTKKHLYIDHESEPSLSWPYELTYGKITDSLNQAYPSGGALTGKSTVNVFGGHIGTLAAPIAESGNVFGSARGDVGPLGVMDTLAIVRETEVNVNFTPSSDAITDATPNVIIGSVYGSGENGTVYENTKVTLADGLVRGSVFGGGDGTDTYMVALKDPNNPSSYLDPSPQRSITSGKVYGNTEIVISGGQVLHNVFGGGNFASVGKGSYMGYGEMSASSITPSPTPYENSGICTVTVTGGTIGTTGYPGDGYKNGFVFGSSKGAPFNTVNLNPLYDYNRDFFLGYVNKTIVNIGSTEGEGTGPQIKGAVFGGGDNGHVRWHTYVNVNKGEIGEGYVPTDGNITDDKWAYRGNVYGAGQGTDKIGTSDDYCPSAGSVTLNTNVTVNGGTIHRNVYGGGSMATVGPLPTTDYDPGTSTCTVNIYGGAIGQVVTPTSGVPYNYGGNVYGAGRGIIDEHAPLTQFASASNAVVNVDNGSGTVVGNVYGGGSYGQVKQETNVNMIGGSVEGSVFGGGMGIETEEIAGLVKGNATVDMTGGTVKRSVYGGGQMGSVGTYTYSTVTYPSNDPNGNAGKTVQFPTACAENTGLATVTMSGGSVGLNGSLMPWENHNPDDDDRGWIFCGGQGVADSITYPKAIALGVVNCTHLQISNTTSGENTITPVVTASVYGGAENGLVLDSTFVEIAGGQIGTGLKSKSTVEGELVGTFDGIYTEQNWSTAITAINNGSIETALGTSGSLHDVFHECDAWEYGDNDGNIKVYDINYGEHIIPDDPSSALYQPEITALQGTNGHSFFGNVFGGGSGSYPIAPGVWRPTSGQVNGNTRVEITGGHILTAVYGGNETTDVKGKSTIKMNGGTVGIPRTMASIQARPVNGNIFGAGMGDPRTMFNAMTNVKKTQVYLTGGTVFGNVYGGSREGHVLDSTLVVIGQEQGKSTLIGTTGFSGYDGLVFGGGRGKDQLLVSDTLGGRRQFPVGRVGGNTHVTMSQGKVLGNVYGGGQVGLVGVDEDGWITSFVQGAVYDSIHHGLSKVEISGGTIGNLANNGDDLLRSDQTAGNVYGGGRGDLDEFVEDDLGRVAKSIVNISGDPDIYGSVFGGGQMANVGYWIGYGVGYAKGTSGSGVNIIGSPKIGTEYEFNYAYTTNDPEHQKTQYDTINGMRMISHTRTGNVFGGGQGNVQVYKDNNGKYHVVGLEHGHLGKTTVSIGMNNGTSGGQILGSVFGGSEQGAIWGDTKVTVTGGTIGKEEIVCDTLKYVDDNWVFVESDSTYSYGSVYGGSYGADAYRHFHMDPSNLSPEYQRKVDSVFLLGGRVYGNTTVEITGGAVRGNVFGGGDMASVGEWDNSFAPTTNTGKATVTIGGSAVIGPFDWTGLNASVFGGGKGIGNDPDNLRKKYCNLNSTEVTVSLGENGRVFGSLFGGGSDAHTLGDTHVKLLSGTIGTEGVTSLDGNVFGGGRNFLLLTFAAGRVGGNTSVEMMGGNVLGSVYGGGRNGLTGFSVDVISTGLNTYQALPDNTNDNTYGRTSVKISGGTVGNLAHMKDSEFSIGNVYGGGKGSKTGIEGHHISSALLVSLVKETEVEISGTARIYGNVYGGSELSNVGNFTWKQNGNAVSEIAFVKSTGHTKVTVSDGTIGMDNMKMITDTGYPDDWGHVFGGCEGWVEELTNSPIIDVELHRLIELMASAVTTEVEISDDAFVLGSVYGGAENGQVLDSTLVKIQGGQIGAGEGIVDAEGHNRPYTDDEWANSATLAPTAHWDYVENGLPYDIYILDSETHKPKPGLDGATFYGNVFGGGSGYYPYGTVGGQSQWLRTAGQVWGNTRVEVTGGHILSCLYGGCETTNIGGYGYNYDIHGEYHVSGGQSTIVMTDGTIGVPRTQAQIEALPVPGYLYGSGKGDPRLYFNTWTNVWSSDVAVRGGRIYGSVFGGGEDGHVMGDVKLSISETDPNTPTIIGCGGFTRFDGNVFGSGRGTTTLALTAGSVSGNVYLTVTGGTIHNSVYGGGNRGSVGTYLVDKFVGQEINPHYGQMRPDDGENTYGYTYVTIGSDDQQSNIEIGHTAVDEHDLGGNVYGGGRGDAGPPESDFPNMAKVKQTTVNIRQQSGKQTWIEGSVFGSGEDGHVLQDTYVNIHGGQIGGHDYGDLEPCNDPYHGNVYGGGRGVDTYEQGGQQHYSVTAGWVQGNTNVNMYGGHVVRNVYGGGNLASVGVESNNATGLASVTITGGTVGTINEDENFGNVFGSGHGGSGEEYVHLAYVKNTHVTIGQTAQIYGSVFGGGEDGHVRKNAIVDIEGGIIGDADDVANQPLDGNVYGGGRGLLLNGESQTAGEVYGYTTVNIKNSTYNEINYSPIIWNNVYGGGSQSVVQQYKVVNVSGGLVHGSVFGGSREIPTQRPNKAPRWVNMWGGTVEGDVYGCSYQGIDGDPANDKAWASFINLSGGTVQGNVYGAGYGGRVKGSVAVLIGKNAIVETSKPGGEFNEINIHRQETPVIANLDIKGSVFGGSYGSIGSTEWDHSFNVVGYSRVYIDGTEYNTTNSSPAGITNYMNIGGGLYGCGTNCESGDEGRNILVRNYGKRIPEGNPDAELTKASRTLTTIQRADTVLLDNTNVNLSGAADISQSDSDRAFAVLQVDNGVYVTNASGIVLGTVDAPVFMDSIHEVKSLHLKEGIGSSYHNMTPSSNNNWEWIGVNPLNPSNPEGNTQENARLYYTQTAPSTPLNYNQENVIIFNGDSRLYVRYLDKSGGNKKRMYGQLQGFFRMRGDFFRPIGTESFAYARPKVTRFNNPIRVTGYDIPGDTVNGCDGGFLSYFDTCNFFTVNGQKVLYYEYTTEGDDGGINFTKTKQYPYFNIGEYVQNRESGEMDLEEFREWVLPRLTGKIWYVDGRGIGNGGWGKDASHQAGWGHFPDMPKLTVSGDTDHKGICKDQTPGEVYNSFNFEEDIIYVVGPVEAIKEDAELNQNTEYSLKLYRYPGGHKMSNGRNDNTVVDATHTAPIPSNTYDGLVNEGESSQMDPSLGPGANLGMMIHANKSNFVMENVLVDGLFGASEGDITTHNIPTSFTSTQMYNVNKPMVVVDTVGTVVTGNQPKQSSLTLKGFRRTTTNVSGETEVVTNGTILQRGYNGIDAATTWYYDADYDCYTESTSGDQQVITVTPQGGGLFVDKDASSTVNVEGLVTIQNNKQRRMVESDDRPVISNVYLPTFSKSLNISGELTATDDATSKIGITSPMRNKEDSYKKNTFSPVAVASDKVNAQKAWEKGNFLDDQEWFFTNEDKTTYYLDKQNTSLNDKALYFGWTWANVVRREPKSGDLSGEVTDNFNITNINSPHDLAWLISLTSNMNGVDPGIDDLAGKTISQTNDINLKQYVWVPVGTNDKPLSGTYDGQGHLIDGLAIEYLSQTDHRYNRTNYGLFGDVNKGKINRTFVVGGLIVPDSIPYQNNSKVATLDYNIGGLAGYLVGTEAMVSNSESAIAISTHDRYKAYAGGLVGLMESGEIHSSMAMPEMTIKAPSMVAPSMAAPSMAGGLVGKSLGGSVNNSFVNAKFVFKNGGQGGGLLGTNEGTKVKNCYVALRETTASDNFDGLVKTQSSGSIDSCYVQNGYTFANSGNFNKNFTPVSSTDTYGYMYSDNKVLDADTAMFRLLNHWVDKTNKTTQKYAHWTRPTLHSINGDLPVLMLCNYDGAGEEGQGDFRSLATFKQGVALQYGGTVRDGSEKELSTMLGRTEDVLVYGDILEDLKDVQVNATKVAIYEHAAILKPGKLGSSDNTYVGVTFDNTSRSAVDAYGDQLGRDWHMFSSPLQNAPLGINYSVNNGEDQNENGVWNEDNPENNRYVYNHWTGDVLPAFHFYPASEKDGYLPSTNPAYNPETDKYKYPYDFYCWYEPDWQWINFKRNGVSHWHFDFDSQHDHPHIDYQATPSATPNRNEEFLVKGKGYQIAIEDDTYLQSHGNLNKDNVIIDVTNTGGGWGVGPLYFGNNLIGNPYHAYLDFNAFGSYSENKLNSFYVYDADTAAKRHVDYLIYPESGSTGGCYASQYLHPHQGFFIQTTESRQLTFTQDMTVTRKDAKNSSFRDWQPAYPLVNLFAYDWEDKGDVLVVEFNRPENGGGIKSKSLRNGNHLVFAHHGDDDYGAFFAKEGTKQVPVRFQSFEKEKKPYTFRWNLQNGDFRSLYLIDNMTGIQYDMLRNDSYSFEASKQDYLSRFLIVFDVTDVEEHTEDINFAFFDGSSWVVNGKGRLEVVDVLGRILHAETLHGDQNRVNLDNYAKGIYLLRLWEGDTPKIQKIIMH